jgi:integrase-like protein
MDEYEIFEIECKKIRKENRKFINGFRQYLAAKKLSQNTIDKHVGHIDFYINEFLLYEEPLRAADGVN